jgi:histone deacetylase 1/2
MQRAKPATKREMTQFHSDEYVDFLSRITPSNMNSFVKEQHKCEEIRPLLFRQRVAHVSDVPDNVGDDCPVFDGLFEYCSISAGGSMGTRFLVTRVLEAPR